MKNLLLVLMVLLLVGCSSSQHTPTQQQINKQANQNLGKAMFGNMKPLTPSGPPLTSYNLNGYKQ